MRQNKKTNHHRFLILISLISIGVLSVFLNPPIQGQINPLDIDLTWSTNTYVPPTYPGKPLPIKGSLVEVAANIYTPSLDANKLIYQWFLNGQIQPEKSGLGKRTFSFTIPNKSTQEIRVRIRDQRNKLLGSSSNILIRPIQPEIVLFAKDNPLSPTKTVFNSYPIKSNQEIIFIAQPYFFNIKQLADLKFQWSLNNQKAEQINQDNPNILSLQITNRANSQLTQNLNLEVANNLSPEEKIQINKKINLLP